MFFVQRIYLQEQGSSIALSTALHQNVANLSIGSMHLTNKLSIGRIDFETCPWTLRLCYWYVILWFFQAFYPGTLVLKARFFGPVLTTMPHGTPREP